MQLLGISAVVVLPMKVPPGMPPVMVPPGMVVEALDVVEEAIGICLMVYNTRT
jgi:hypothetical protein